MHHGLALGKTRVPFPRVHIDFKDGLRFQEKEYFGHESRATRLVGDSKRFLTVSFWNGTNEQIKEVLEYITRPGEGVIVGGQRYEFLGFTENNLKAGILSFFREGPDFTVEGLRHAFGDLKAVYDKDGYGKFAARLGLSFSSTVATEEIDPTEVHLLDDLFADDGSLTSDGCGLIRHSFCSEICEQLGVAPDTAVLQIRWGGTKGLLVRCQDDLFDEMCGSPDKKIAVRPSMIKYKGGPRVLEVQNVSRPPKSGRLNKLFIALLLTCGIPLSVFQDLLQAQLDEIDMITTDREKALQCVDGEIDAESKSFGQDLFEMLLAGHDMNEPYLATLLLRFQNTARTALREKLHISVKGSVNVPGVVDHYGVLAEGEVYINLRGTPHVGLVAVMRNPAYDPDGIRVLEAVSRPALKHLTNCIVFACSGAHSETDRMSGGDLDGDLYYVILNPLLIPPPKPRIPVPEPEEPQAPVRSNSRATTARTISLAGITQVVSGPRRRNTDMRTDAVNTFLEGRCNFLLSKMSKAWMEFVGRTSLLASHPQCLALVPLIESALDALKAGTGLKRLGDDFRKVKERIDNHETPAVDLDWVNPLEVLTEQVPQAIKEEMTFDTNPELILRSSTSEQEWERLAIEARRLMLIYNQGLKSSIDADKENKLFGLDDEKRADIFKAEFIEKHFPPVVDFLVDVPKYLLKASVWYAVGYAEKKQSFAWGGARWLNYIKATKTGFVPLAVGARSTPLVAGAPRTNARLSAAAVTQPIPAISRIIPPNPEATTPDTESPESSNHSTPTSSAPSTPPSFVHEISGGDPETEDELPVAPPRSDSPSGSVITVRSRTTIMVTSPTPSQASSSRRRHHHLFNVPTPAGTYVCRCGVLSPLRNWDVNAAPSASTN
ncbi:RNA-dependent RNA polymerase [Favolaschia claudopus]|uniref:RNA-dependent RNA polymerase n=1 Tax=Favolaschia claudopus TaxID=2862362 RepID=A0AAW0AK59_9AGAR